MPMQTDNEDEHRRSRAGTAGDRQATGERGGGSPARGTLSPPPALSQGLRVADRPSERPHAPSPAHPSCPSGRPPASVSGASSRLPSPNTERVLRGFRTTTRPQRCRPTPGQTHGTAARRQAAQTQTQHAGTGPRGGPARAQASSEAQGSQREEGWAGPGRQQRTGLWGRRQGRRLVAGHSPGFPPQACCSWRWLFSPEKFRVASMVVRIAPWREIHG